MVPFPRLVTALGDVPDPRRAQGKRYPLPYLLSHGSGSDERSTLLWFPNHPASSSRM